MIDLNHGSRAVYAAAEETVGERINSLIDRALLDRHAQQEPRDYLGGSRIGEPCARKLVYEVMHTAIDSDKGFDGRTLRIFDVGHQFETLSIGWLRAAGFDLRTHRRDGGQFGFVTAGGRVRGHIDGVIVAGPDIGVAWPALFEHKAFQYWAPDKLLAVPQSTYEYLGTTAEGWSDYRYLSRLELVTVDTETGLSRKGRIDHSAYYEAPSEHRWTYVDIRRSIFMGDFVYAISDRGITAHRQSDLELTAEAALPGTLASSYGWGWGGLE